MFLQYGDKILYQSQPRQTIFHEDTARCRMYGGSAGGGKTEAILWEIFALCNDTRFPLLNGVIFRKTFPEIEKYFIQRALDKFPKKLYRYSKKDHIMTFTETGSRVQFAYCEGDNDVNQYQGAEWDFLAIDEFTHHSEYVFKYLFTRLRTNKKYWTPIFFGGSNPGGVGHGWVKRIFVDRELLEEEKKFTWSFIPARLSDNPKMLEDNPEYADQLDMIPDPMIRRALKDGDWNIFAGQYFTELRVDVHGFEPFEIPKTWSRFLEIDYGYDHPAVCHWNAIDEDGEVWKYKELVCRNKTYTQFGELILDMCDDDEKFEYAIADPAIWAKKGNGGGLSGAEELQEVLDAKKIVLMPADNDRVNGWGIMREWLKVFDKDGKPHARMHISNNLKWWWKKVPECQRNPKKPEDVLKADGDDSADATRYGLMSRPRPAKRKAKEETKDRYGQPIKKKKILSMSGRENWHPMQKPEYKGLWQKPK